MVKYGEFFGIGLCFQETSTHPPGEIPRSGQGSGGCWGVTILLLPPQFLWEGLQEAVGSVFLGNDSCEQRAPPEAMGGTVNNHPRVEMKLAAKLMLFHLPGKPELYQVPAKQNQGIVWMCQDADIPSL